MVFLAGVEMSLARVVVHGVKYPGLSKYLGAPRHCWLTLTPHIRKNSVNLTVMIVSDHGVFTVS